MPKGKGRKSGYRKPQRSRQKSHQKSFSYKYTRRNDRALNRSKKKQANIDLDTYKKHLNQLSKVKFNANASEEDLEIYTINNRIIYLLLVKLLVLGTAKSIDMASEYATKNNISIDNVRAGMHSLKTKIPTIKSQVKKIKEKGKHPDFASMHIGWETGLFN